MKNIYSLLSSYSRTLPVLTLIVLSFVLFQGQVPDRVFNDNDPYIDQPTREFYTHFVPPNAGEKDVYTSTDGFDNFNIYDDYAEQHLTSNPRNPLQFFFGVNRTSAMRGYRNIDGHEWSITNPAYVGGTCCDPWTATDSIGTLYYGTLHTGAGHYVYKSTNYGLTWGPAILATSGNDRNTIAADQTNGPYSNYVYSAITPGNFSRTTDLGVTWTQTFSATNIIPGVMIAVGPNGNTQGGCVIYVTNTGSSASCTYTFHRSTDGGLTFQTMSSINVAGFVGTLNAVGRLVINNARTRPYPMIAMDNSYGPYRGRLYLVYASNEPPGDGYKPDIKLQYSTDQGASWSSWVRVNDNANPEQSDQWYPAIWCDKETGKLYIKWYDTRNSPANYGVDVYATYTTNGGQSFVPNQKLTNTTTPWLYPRPPCPANDNCYRGDYDAIVSNSLTSLSVWYDGRNNFYENMAAYFPDFAMKVSRDTLILGAQSDSGFAFVKVPAVKLYTDKVKFSASITPVPSAGTVTMSFLNKTSSVLQDSLTSYPDSLRIRVRTSGGVTSGSYIITIQGNGSNGTPVHRRNLRLIVPPIGIRPISSEIPKEFYLYQNFPNPFNPSTNIRFDIAKAGRVKLTVYSITGQEIATLINGVYNAGKYIADFSGDGISSGVYFYRIETPDFVGIKKMVLIK